MPLLTAGWSDPPTARPTSQPALASGAMQPAGADGCVNPTGADGCMVLAAMQQPFALAVSPDGRQLYVGSLTGPLLGFARRP